MYHRPNPAEPPENKPTPAGVTDTTASLLHSHLGPREYVHTAVLIAEVACCPEDGNAPTTYRRLRVSDAGTHPGILESLVRHTAQDLAAELHPSSDANSGRMKVHRHGS